MVAAGLAIIPAGGALAAVACDPAALVTAVNAANGGAGGGVISLTAGCTYTYAASNDATDGGNALPAITGNVTINGNGATITRSTAAGTPQFRLIDVPNNPAQLTLNSLTISNGDSAGSVGGGAIFSRGTLNLNLVVVSGSTAPGGAGLDANNGVIKVSQSTFANNTTPGSGGGIAAEGLSTLTVSQSTFLNNTASAGGGALMNDNPVTVSNSTFAGNTAGDSGGGAIQAFGNAAVSQSTISGNTSPFGAGVHTTSTGEITLVQSIVVKSMTGPNCGGAQQVVDGGYNIEDGTSCGFSGTSLSNTDPHLGPLGNNGGPTQTFPIAAGSAALDRIPYATPGCSGTDQRGVARPQGFGCDVGSYELAIARIATSLHAYGLLGTGLHPTARLTRHDNGAPIAGQTITFTAGRIFCTATTDGNGVAQCRLTLNGILGYNASYAGSPAYLPSSGSAGLL
jgi:predicted outer membrane repeat protein